MRVLLISAGSLGDTLPFLAWAKALAARGHNVTAMINGYYKGMFEKAGIDIVELSTAEEHAKTIEEMKLFTQSHRANKWRDDVARTIETVYQATVERYIPGETVVAAQAPWFGARVAQEKLGLPLATVHLQPLFFRSVYDSTGPTERMPLWLGRGIDRLIDLGLDTWLGPTINKFRAQVGLPGKVSKVLKHWWNSPQMVIGMFPAWFNAPQIDWPANSMLVGFPFSPDDNQHDLSELEAFLAQGDAPVVFSVSSFTTDAHTYFRQSIDAAQALGRRAVFLTPYQDQIPRPLPDGIRAYPFVPLEKLLPRAAAHVHHSGSGTVALTLSAGIPQLAVPNGIDQVDISYRLERLGVSATILPKAYSADSVASTLRRLLDSPDVAARCQKHRELSRQMNAIEEASDALERLHEQTRTGQRTVST